MQLRKITMKIASIILLAGSASAFTSPAAKAIVSNLKMADVAEEESVVVEPVMALPKMSQALPFLTRPAALDGTLAGDVGFDPFGFSKSKEDLMNFREAEIKHSRLAMLVSNFTSHAPVPTVPSGLPRSIRVPNLSLFY